MDDFYKLLPLIFKTPNRINSMLFKNDKLEYFKNNGVIELYEKYTNSEISPESLVIDYYKQKGYYSFFAENDYWTLLFFSNLF